MEITMESELLSQLTAMGFELGETGELSYAEGSIANYRKAKVCQPRQMYSLVEDGYVYACYVEIERSSEPGYIECDWTVSKKGCVAVHRLVAFLKKELGLR